MLKLLQYCHHVLCNYFDGPTKLFLDLYLARGFSAFYVLIIIIIKFDNLCFINSKSLKTSIFEEKL